jgi:hypothetical protein
MDESLYSRAVSFKVPNLDVSLYIGMLEENDNLKELVDVTEYLQDDVIPLTKNFLDGISNISNISLYFPIKKISGNLDFLINKTIDITNHPFIVAYKDEILFNGYVKIYDEEQSIGEDPDIIVLKLSIIHKSYDLKVNTGEITSNGQEIKSFLRNLIDNSDLKKYEVEVY